MVSRVRLLNITKRFSGGVIANNNVSIEAKSGEVHALLGENGAGKTTLMKILAGLYRPDSGTVEINGSLKVFHNPAEAKKAGIRMVHQHFSLVPALTVAENMALSDIKGKFLLRPKQWRQYLLKTAERLGFEIRPDVPVWQLSLGERQRVEIFRLIMEDAKILILDEPTSILAPHEAELLFKHIWKFAETGHVVFLVTHKIPHIRAVAKGVTVLRKGRVVASVDVNELDDHELSELMVGKKLTKEIYQQPQWNKVANSRCLLTVKDLTVKPRSSPCGIREAGFTLHSGEILGVAGISGNGQDELVAALTGMVKYEGVINFNLPSSPDSSGAQIGYIPADRCNVGVAMTLSVEDNLALRRFNSKPFSSGLLLRKRPFADFAREKISQFGIRPDNPAAPVGKLSGGNIQKVVLARELDGSPPVVIAENPTAGLDVQTVHLVHSEILRQVEKGAGVLLVSEDIDELLLLCRRIMILYDGQIQGIFDTASFDKGKIGLLMSGVKPKMEINSQQALMSVGNA